MLWMWRCVQYVVVVGNYYCASIEKRTPSGSALEVALHQESDPQNEWWNFGAKLTLHILYFESLPVYGTLPRVQ